MDCIDEHVAGMGYFLLDESGEIITWNKDCETLLGYLPHDVLQRPLASLVSPDLRAAFERAAHGERERPTVIMTALTTASGEALPVALTLLPQVAAGARPAGSVVAVQPGTGRDRALAFTEHERIANMPLGAMVNMLPGTFYVMDVAGKFVMWNTRVEQATQLSAAEVEAMSAFDMFGEADRDRVAAKVGEVFEHEGEVVVEAGLRSKDGRVTPFLFTGTRFSAEDKLYLCGMGLDLTQRRRQEQELRLKDRALHASSNGIFIVRCVDRMHVFDYVNPAFERITGLRMSEVMGRDSQHMCGFIAMPGLDELERAQIRKALHEHKEARATFRSLRKSGELFWNDMTVAPVFGEHGRVTHFIGVINDVTEARQRTSRLEHEINHDVLTGLANRNLMWDRLEHAIHLAQREKTLVAVVLVDLDKFKEINDTLGHEAGDEVLRVLARKMESSVRDSDTVARLGGDEFVLILSNQPSVRYTLRMIDRIRNDLGTALFVNGQELFVEASMGVSMFPHDGKTVGELIQSADVAMYHAKASGRNGAHFFSNDMRATSEAKHQLRDGLRQALDNHEFFLLFQPKVCVRTGNIIGAEALVRWRHPKHGILLPSAFIPEAEENGLILPLGEWVFRQVCAAIERLGESGFASQIIGMNASLAELSQRHYIAQLGARLAAARISPARFELEICESTLVKNPELAQRLFDDVGRAGFRLALDEFGAGMVSLKNLQSSPVATLKIYRACVGQLDHDELSAMGAKTIIGMGRLMNVSVVGMAVETISQFDFLRLNGCDRMQGNYFSPPVSIDEYERLLHQGVSPGQTIAA